jgi:hypothetical protein
VSPKGCATSLGIGRCGGVAGIGLVEIGWAALVATLPVLALHDGGAAVAGWLLGSFGAGSVIGGLLFAGAHRRWPHHRLGDRRDRRIHLAAPATGPGVGVRRGDRCERVCSGLYFPRFFSALTSSTPPAPGSVMTSVTIAISAPGPLGFLGAGLLAQQTGSTTASLLLVSTAATLGAAFVIRAPAVKA